MSAGDPQIRPQTIVKIILVILAICAGYFVVEYAILLLHPAGDPGANINEVPPATPSVPRSR